MFYKRKKVVHFTLNLKGVKDAKDTKVAKVAKDSAGTVGFAGTVGSNGHHDAHESKEELVLRLKFEKNMRKLFGIIKKI